MPDKITNGDFFLPNILGFQGEVGGVQYYDTFLQDQKDILIWVGSDGDLSVQNNDNGITSFGYPDISLLGIQGASGVNLYQYVSFENTACLYQSFNLTKIGIYNLSFLYVSRPNFLLNNLQIFFNNVLLDVISTPQASWTEYSLSFPVSTTGSYKLFFQGQPDITDANIAITNIKLFEPPSIIGGVKTVYNNNFKSTNINGYLNVVSTSGIIGQITTNFLTCNKNLTMPANGTNSIYYRDISSNTIGRLFGTQLQMYMDYYNIMSFRYCALNGYVIGAKLNINSQGIVVNSNTKTSYYHLDVYGNAGAYIRGPLKVLGDITYSDSVSLISTLTTLSGRIFTISDLVNTTNLNLASISGRLNTANTNIATNTSNIATANSNIATANSNIATANSNIATANSNIATINSNIASINTNLATNNANIATNTLDITSLSGRLNTANTNIASNTTSINTLNTKTTKIHYPGTLNTTFIGRTSDNATLDFSDGGLIMNNTSEILGKNFGCNIYAGNGFFFNTNSNRRSDFVNIVGYSPASNWATLGGFEFWIHSFTKPPYVVAAINYLGSLTISGITTSTIAVTNNITSPLFTASTNITSPLITASTNITSPLFTASTNITSPLFTASTNITSPLFTAATNITSPLITAATNITSPLLTATTRIVTPYITLNNLYDVGRSITISGNITLTFPLPQIIFCNCTTSAVNITLPDIASLAATSTCRIQIRRILNTLNQINLLCFGTQQRIYNTTNVLGTASNAIGNNCQLLLNGNFWYSTSG